MKPFSKYADKNYETVRAIQHNICTALESLDTQTFKEDYWERPRGGFGYSRVLENGSVFEKAGVNVSKVHGTLSETEKPLFQQLINKTNNPITLEEETQFLATGVSLVIHPFNPLVPTTHANYRYFECQSGDATIWWYGGGADLTPYYLVEEDAIHYHQVHKDICDRYNPEFYPDFKKQCDEYFYLPHRQEERGIGGIFFDYLQTPDQETLNTFITECGQGFIDAYVPVVQKHVNETFTPEQKEWQEIRRGRYVEFNLIYDRGTLFGLKTNGRTESILMSLPKTVQWHYNRHPQEGTPESQLVNVLQNPKNWVH